MARSANQNSFQFASLTYSRGSNDGSNPIRQRMVTVIGQSPTDAAVSNPLFSQFQLIKESEVTRDYCNREEDTHTCSNILVIFPSSSWGYLRLLGGIWYHESLKKSAGEQICPEWWDYTAERQKNKKNKNQLNVQNHIHTQTRKTLNDDGMRMTNQ